MSARKTARKRMPSAEQMARRIEATNAIGAWNALREHFWRSQGRWDEARRADLGARLASSPIGILERLARAQRR